MHGLSAHADVDGLLRWLRTATRVRDELGWATVVPAYDDRATLD